MHVQAPMRISGRTENFDPPDPLDPHSDLGTPGTLGERECAPARARTQDTPGTHRGCAGDPTVGQRGLTINIFCDTQSHLNMSRQPHDIGELSSEAWFQFRARNDRMRKTSSIEQLRTNSKLLRNAMAEIEELRNQVVSLKFSV